MTEFATADDLMAKPLRRKSVPLTLPQADGSQRTVTVLFQALPAQDYDDLVSKHQPTAKQREDGIRGWNPDTFPAALISKSLVQPTLSVEQVRALYVSANWSDGERASLFAGAYEVNQAGIDVPFTETASVETGSSSSS